ncbi:MAG: fused MFS/spermidine synthase, partial [Candidatus Hydrogenedentes bacterium]|nr:fused MFS/spermidine synthase [Candidatus Hydrogenedentota bacterium]
MTTSIQSKETSKAGIGVALAFVLLFFFVSGSCGLIYQIIWTRKLALLFGTTAYAISTALTIFFLGLGIGSLLGGKLADRTRFPLRFYGVFEIIISLWACLFILALPMLESILPTLLRLADFSHFTGIALRALLALALLFVPVTLMGATLPLLSRFVAGSNRSFGRRLGALYAVNTFGAVLGCFITGFVLISKLGYTRATLVGFTLNLFVGLGAIALSFFREPISYSRNKTDSDTNDPPCETRDNTAGSTALQSPYTTKLLLLATAVCGFSGLALEVILTRLLAIVFLGTTYAYTTMLTAFLCGIAIGGACAAMVADRFREKISVIGATLMVLAVCVVMLLGWTAALPERFIEMSRSVHTEWSGVTRGTFLLSFFTLFPMTFLFGFLFPLILRAYSAVDAHTGRNVGRVYSANTFGGVLGAVAGGFLLLPRLGAHWSILTLALLLLFMGILVLWSCGTTGVRRKTIVTLILLTAFGIATSRIPNDVSRELNIGYVPADHRVLFFQEGVEGTVVVTEPETAVAGEDRVLWINRVQATTSIERGVKMNRLQGVLPLLFERDYPDVLFMCFGSGITCGTLALYDFDTIDAVEISPEVLEAAPFFGKDNLGVLHNPKVHFHIDDGRNYLLRTDKRYDVITFEPMPLALAGVSAFYTREYYTLCLNSLKPGGIVSQWIPLHSNDPEVVRDLAYTFTSVFPEYCAFFVNADLFLIGSDAPLKMHYEKAKERLSTPALQPILEEAGLGDTIEVLSCYLFDKEGLDQFTQGAKSMSDDRPLAEFIAPRLVYARLVPESLRLLLPNMTNPVTAVLPESIGTEALHALEKRYHSRRQDMDALQQYYGASSFDDSAANGFIASLEIDPDNLTAQYYLREIVVAQGSLLLRWQDYERAAALIERALVFLPTDPEILALFNA